MRTILSICIAAAVAVIAYSGVAEASPCQGPAKTVQTSSAKYGPDSTFEALDAYVPAATSGEPVVLFAHGGGWSRGDKAQYRELGQAFAACGVAFIALNYPLAPQARADAAAADIDRAVNWAVDNASASTFSRTKIYLMGHGAGAQLVALAALDGKLLTAAGVPTRSISGVVALDGEAYDPSQLAATAEANPSRYAAYMLAFGSDPAQWKQYDCGQFLAAGAPPFLVVHGADDYLTSASYSSGFVDELTRAHDKVTYLQPDGSDYSGVLVNMVRSPDDPVFTAVIRFVSGS
ncbi:MAG: alpha/beta hydrolase [Candidatus Eremiobacteraeota bacterium]|nr:alpha/beta hydrolase [Candidatus Eremiobacteraeota bacterium]